jgi:hypothetical protein
MTTILHCLTLTFRSDGAVDAVFVRKGRERRHYKIHARFDDDGWRQWGESHSIIADNVCTMTRIKAILNEEEGGT